MKSLTAALLYLGMSQLAFGAACATASLSTYLNGGAAFSCAEGNLTVSFNHDLLPSFVGLTLLSQRNSAASASSITVVPGGPGLDFNSASFVESASLISSQSELVHFLLQDGSDDITATTLSLHNAATSTGTLGLGTGVAIGQELVCVGGTFTSLPTGLITSVANGLLSTGAYGCNGTAIIGTAAASSGSLSAISSVLSLPNLTGLTDTAFIQLSGANRHELDVIKLQALIAVGGGSASDSGFGNVYALASTTTTTAPEPGSFLLLLSAGVLLVSNRGIGRQFGQMGRRVRGSRG